MFIPEELFDKIRNFDNTTFDVFCHELERCLFTDIIDYHNFECFQEDVEERDNINLMDKDPYDTYNEEIHFRGNIVDRFKKTKDIEQLNKDIAYIRNSSLSNSYWIDLDLRKIFKELGITLDETKEIILRNS